MQELQVHANSSVCPLCAAPIVDRAAVIQRYLDECDRIDREIFDLENSIGSLATQLSDLRKHYLDIRQKLESRKNLDKQIGQFNERLLAIKRASESRERLLSEIASLNEKIAIEDYAQVERESLIAVKAEIHKLDFDPLNYANLQSQIRAQRHIEIKHQQLQKDLSELKRIAADLPLLDEKATALADEISAESYGNEERSKLQEIQETIVSLLYDRIQHAELKGKLAELLLESEQIRDLRRAIADKPGLLESERACQKILAEKEAQLQSLEAERRRLSEELSNLASLKQELSECAPLVNELRAAREESAKQVAVLESQIEHLNNDLQSLSEQQQELESTLSSADDYQFLAEAFGKKGIQAVIIENAIPEIETEANRILSRLTENKMHIALVTQHKTRSGNIVETLDLLIADEVGTRSYELFSGGEAFKVNFAVRVALARLLARRAGAKLETLIIDEGFGSQDDASREKLVRAIRTIQSDFGRILVITHMADIREMFPTQIQVTKVNGESRLQVAY
jgi:exonuclease SbcC